MKNTLTNDFPSLAISFISVKNTQMKEREGRKIKSIESVNNSFTLSKAKIIVNYQYTY